MKNMMGALKKKESLKGVIAVGALSLIAALLFAAPAGAVDVLQESCSAGGGSSSICGDNSQLLGGGGSIFSNIISTIIYVVGAVAVIMIVIGGFRYVLANGDQSQITSAKNTILYAVIGLVLAVAANAIVSFVLNQL